MPIPVTKENKRRVGNFMPIKIRRKLTPLVRSIRRWNRAMITHRLLESQTFTKQELACKLVVQFLDHNSWNMHHWKVNINQSSKVHAVIVHTVCR